MSFSFGLVHRERQRLRVWAKKVKTGQLVSHCSRHLCSCHRVHVLRPYPAMFFPCSKSTISCVRSKISCFFISKISSFRKQKIMLLNAKRASLLRVLELRSWASSKSCESIPLRCIPRDRRFFKVVQFVARWARAFFVWKTGSSFSVFLLGKLTGFTKGYMLQCRHTRSTTMQVDSLVSNGLMSSHQNHCNWFTHRAFLSTQETAH